MINKLLKYIFCKKQYIHTKIVRPVIFNFILYLTIFLLTYIFIFNAFYLHGTLALPYLSKFSCAFFLFIASSNDTADRYNWKNMHQSLLHCKQLHLWSLPLRIPRLISHISSQVSLLRLVLFPSLSGHLSILLL